MFRLRYLGNPSIGIDNICTLSCSIASRLTQLAHSGENLLYSFWDRCQFPIRVRNNGPTTEPDLVHLMRVIDAFGSAFSNSKSKWWPLDSIFSKGRVPFLIKSKLPGAPVWNHRKEVKSGVPPSFRSVPAWTSVSTTENDGSHRPAKQVGSGLPYFTDLIRSEDGGGQTAHFLKW